MNGDAVHTIPVNGNQEHDTVVMPDMVKAALTSTKNDSDRES